MVCCNSYVNLFQFWLSARLLHFVYLFLKFLEEILFLEYCLEIKNKVGGLKMFLWKSQQCFLIWIYLACKKSYLSVFHWVSHSPTDWVSHSPTDWVSHSPTDWVSHSPTDWVSHSPNDWVSHIPTDWVSHSPTDWVSHSPTDWVSHSPTDRVSHSPTDWVSHSPTDWACFLSSISLAVESACFKLTGPLLSI